MTVWPDAGAFAAAELCVTVATDDCAVDATAWGAALDVTLLVAGAGATLAAPPTPHRGQQRRGQEQTGRSTRPEYRAPTMDLAASFDCLSFTFGTEKLASIMVIRPKASIKLASLILRSCPPS